MLCVEVPHLSAHYVHVKILYDPIDSLVDSSQASLDLMHGAQILSALQNVESDLTTRDLLERDLTS